MFGSKGKIDIVIQKYNYAPGDNISGNVALLLRKPVNAREMSISLVGEQLITNTQDIRRKGLIMDDEEMSGSRMGSMMGSSSRRWGSEGMMIGTRREKSTTTDRVRVYNFKQQLDSEKEYSQGQEYYFFEIKIPKDILGTRPEVTSLAPSYPIKWYLLAKLDIPGRPDISRKVDITIVSLERPPDPEVKSPSTSPEGPPGAEVKGPSMSLGGPPDPGSYMRRA
jgi:hypothetical protein